jgi:hypothetical protein
MTQRSKARGILGSLGVLTTLGTLFVMVLSQACTGHAQDTPGSESTQTRWYDATPLLASLRPAARQAALRGVGVTRADELPLYELGIDVDLGAGVAAVREELWFTNREAAALDELVLRIPANSVRAGEAGREQARLPVRFVGGRCLGDTTCTLTSPSSDVVIVRTATPLAPGGRLRVSIELGVTLARIESSRTTLLAQGIEGLAAMGSPRGAGDYGLVAIGDGIASLANFYAVLAPRAGGRWVRAEETTLGDLGSDALAHFRARLRLGDGVRFAATGTTLSAPTAPRGERPRQEVVAAFARDFALLASRELTSESRDVGGVTVRSWFRPSERAAGEHVLDVAAHALGVFERRFGPYPYPELDVVEAAITGGAGGVEFSGLVTVASMLYKPMAAGGDAGGGLGALLGGMLAGGAAGAGDMDATTARMREFVTAHEVAHQLWHGLVGSDSRMHPWLDESLAQWSAMLYVEERYGRARARAEGDRQVRMNYQLMRLQGAADGAVDRPVSAFASPIAYAGLVYGKGPYFYEAVRAAIGDDALFAALADYARRFAFGTAPRRAIVDVLAAHGDARRVRALAQRWLDERHGDEDLGRGDARTLVATTLGVDADALPPGLESIFGALAGGLGGATGAGGTGGVPGGADIPPELLEALGGMLGAGGAGARGGTRGTRGIDGAAADEAGLGGLETMIQLLENAGE